MIVLHVQLENFTVEKSCFTLAMTVITLQCITVSSFGLMRPVVCVAKGFLPVKCCPCKVFILLSAFRDIFTVHSHFV